MDEQIRKWLFSELAIKLATLAVLLLVVFAAVRLSTRTIGKYVLDADSRYRARKFVGFLGYLLAIGVIATVFSDRLGGLTVAFGVAGAGIAFALQEVIASAAGWVALSVGNFYRTGDRIQLGGVKGDVIDIGILRTTLMELGEWVNADLYNGRIVRVANSFVFKEPVVNYSGDFPFLWDEIIFPVKYGSDWRHAREVFARVVQEVIGDYAAQSKDAWKSVARKYRIEEAQVEPMVTIRADENWIEFTARYIVDYRKRRTTKDQIYTRILEEVDRSEDRIRIATASFEVAPVGTMDVRVAEPAGDRRPR